VKVENRTQNLFEVYFMVLRHALRLKEADASSSSCARKQVAAERCRINEPNRTKQRAARAQFR
jgi:hypothetical protein